MHNTKRIAVIGAGISGLSVAQMLRKDHAVTIFERHSHVGGLLHCKTLQGGLFHTCGGHVFNTKDKAVEKWFWSFFDRDAEFIKAKRNAAISFDQFGLIPYPIENHVYMLGKAVLDAFYRETAEGNTHTPDNFRDFLLQRFGETLYNLYFGPYNEKIWQQDLSTVPLGWLEGKLPTPSHEDMVKANQEHLEEQDFVHATFWYPKSGGSQFVADRLSQGLSIRYGNEINRLIRAKDGCWTVGGEVFDGIVFCGNIKQLPSMLGNEILPDKMAEEIDNLSCHGTTSVFCSLEATPYSWVYQPSRRHSSHRIICTGNFSPANNPTARQTAVVEFTGEINKDEIIRQLALMPFNPRYIGHQYNPYTYPIQHVGTRQLIQDVKNALVPHNIRLVGRFAEWEYFNMDAAISSARKLDFTFNQYT